MNTRNIVALSLLSGLLAAGSVSAGEYTEKAKDAWLDGKLESTLLLNRHLNSFEIDTEVDNGIAYLSGTVESGVDRSLAEELALGIEGITKVENKLNVDADLNRREVPARADMNSMQAKMHDEMDEMRDDMDAMDDDHDHDRTFAQFVDDVTTTATVKTRLMAEWNVTALEIDVDTMHNTVELSGEVDSEQEKQLAEQIARNTSDVRDVRNNLVVDAD